ncbi:N-6 DNA methylase [Roseomonas sp. CECT 9278]|uniref:N-6 DNA methylase n=1 Tax=Roseomonas sp. CECT 9278 TaxID=2845823 RepID=UPI001E4A5CB8|nr:N-6 DNA methylase [Roseomonas sp. CECT 9278]
MHADHQLASPSGQMELIRTFQHELQRAAAESGQDLASLVLTVAQMRVAARLLPVSGPNGMGFLDMERELTAPDWQAMLDRLPAAWPQAWRAPGATFSPVSQPLPPGHLERLRRLALATHVKKGEAADAVSPMRGWIRRALLAASGDRALSASIASFELCQLIATAIDPTEAQHVYCAYGMTAIVATHIAEIRCVQVTLDVEEGWLAGICACIAVADDLPLIVRERDPLTEPANVDQELFAEQESYDAAIVFPPVGMRSRGEDYRSLGTNLPQPGVAEGQYVALALARGRRAAVCLLPTGFLFRTTKADQAFKEQAIRLFGLDAVISLPRDAFPSSSLIQVAMLVFRPKAKVHPWMRQQQRVLMVDGRPERERDKSRPSTIGRFSTIRDLADILQHHTETDFSVLASADEIAGHDFNLSVERYVLDSQARRMRDLLANAEAVPLEDVAEISRPQALLVGRDRAGRESRETDVADRSDGVLLEVGVGDIDDAGVVRMPTTSVPASDELLQRTRRARLEPGDVLIVIKGSVGKVGFVRDIPDGPAWLASQSFAILRLRRRGPIIDPAILFRFLSSSMGQVTVQSLKVGSVISGLQMADLRRLPVLVPSAEAQGAIAAQMSAIFDMQEKIQEMRQQLIQRQKTIWPEMDAATPENAIYSGGA